MLSILALVSFRDLPSVQNTSKLGGLFETGDKGKKYNFYNSDRSVMLDTSTYISFSDFEEIQKERGPYRGVHKLNIRLNASGTLKFEQMTKRNVGKQIYFVIGEKVMATPVINEVVHSGEGSLLVTDQAGTGVLLDYLQSLKHLPHE